MSPSDHAVKLGYYLHAILFRHDQIVFARVCSISDYSIYFNASILSFCHQVWQLLSIVLFSCGYSSCCDDALRCHSNVSLVSDERRFSRLVANSSFTVI